MLRTYPVYRLRNAVHIQLVPNIRKWVPGTIIKKISDRSYKVKTVLGGVYVRNRKFIKIRHSDSKQSLKTVQEPENTIQSRMPKRITRRIESMKFISKQH